MFKLTPREQKLVMILGALLLLGVVLRFTLPEEHQGDGANWGVGQASVEYSSSRTQGDPNPSGEKVSFIIVHVTGSVLRPGVYELNEGARVIDALEKAGGSLEGADLERINLAQPLIDGQQVFIPKERAEGDDAGLVSQQVLPFDTRVNINHADQSELETLPGIGSVKARSIISHRQKNGPFHSVEDLLQVSGIGEKTLESIKDLVTVY